MCFCTLVSGDPQLFNPLICGEAFLTFQVVMLPIILYHCLLVLYSFIYDIKIKMAERGDASITTEIFSVEIQRCVALAKYTILGK